MYKIDELEIQNLQDSWSAMYVILARSVMDTLGRAGEGVLRESIRRFGRDRGLTNRQHHLDNNIKINLKSISAIECDCPGDPRFRENLLRLDEQVHLADVITCPLADLWIKYGEKDLGRIYCEEFYHAYFRAYCYDKAQVNLSKTLTHDGDNHCRFAVYFRPANLSEETRPKCFAEFDPRYEFSEEPIMPSVKAKNGFASLWLKMYYYLLEVADELYGCEGRCAIAIGLQKLGDDAAGFMKKRADMTGNVPNSAYVSANYPINIDIDNDIFWEKYEKYDAKELLKINFNRVFKEKLSL